MRLLKEVVSVVFLMCLFAGGISRVLFITSLSTGGSYSVDGFVSLLFVAFHFACKLRPRVPRTRTLVFLQE